LTGLGDHQLNELGTMYAVVITDEGGARRRLDVTKPELTIGRVQGNDVILGKRNVSKQHARLIMKQGQAVIVDLNSTNGTWVNGRKLTAPHALKPGDKIYIADFILTLEQIGGLPERKSASPSVSEPPPLPTRSAEPPASSIPAREPLPPRRGVVADSGAPGGEVAPDTSLPPGIEERATDAPEAQEPARTGVAGDPLPALLERLATRIDIDKADPAAMENQERWSKTRAAIAETFLVLQTEGLIDANVDMRKVAHAALHEAVGLGALDDLLSNEAIRGILVNGHEHLFIDKGTGLEASEAAFSSPEALRRVARRLAAHSGQSLEGQPALHGRLAFGPRLTILQPPLVSRGPVIELTMSPSRTLDELAEAGWMSAEAARHLAKAVAECRNIVVAGSRGSGVTEVMSALAQELPETESSVAVEAIPNLDIDRESVVSIVAADSGISLEDAILHGTRLRSEHLIINDLTGAATLDALTAVLGREPGHLLGVHCWSAKDAIEALLLAAACGGADRASVAQLIGGAIDLVVATQRGPGGPRVTAVLEIQGHEGGDVSFQSVPF
jgi:pilus assembly protein CpaF